MKMLTSSRNIKISLFSISVSVALVGILALYFRRRRRRPKAWRELSVDKSEDLKSLSDASTVSGQSLRRRDASNPASNIALNGDISGPQSMSSMQMMDSTDLTVEDTLSTISTVTTVVKKGLDTSRMKPDELCDLGMQELRVAIRYWEDALDKIDNMDEDKVDRPTEELQYEICELLERAYRIQECFEVKMFKNYSANVAVNAAIQEMDREFEERKRRSVRSLRSIDDSSSDVESFISAVDFADLSDLEEQKQNYPHLAFYEAALIELEHGCIPCRTLRTKMLGCNSDTEFLAKLYCVRTAFQELFKDATVRAYFADCGRRMISELLVKADRDPEEFEEEYRSLLEWVQEEDNLAEMEDELKSRGVKVMSFYDIVIDFIMLDAFDDLENPPSSVVSVVNNRWLSNGFKESALSAAVWSVLKAKKRMLKYPKGFVAHFYGVCEHTNPVIAWGFLGPDSGNNLKAHCNIFKDAVLGFMQDVFSFDKVRYTTVEQSRDDILKLARDRITTTMQVLSAR